MSHMDSVYKVCELCGISVMLVSWGSLRLIERKQRQIRTAARERLHRRRHIAELERELGLRE